MAKAYVFNSCGKPSAGCVDWTHMVLIEEGKEEKGSTRCICGDNTLKGLDIEYPDGPDEIISGIVVEEDKFVREVKLPTRAYLPQ